MKILTRDTRILIYSDIETKRSCLFYKQNALFASEIWCMLSSGFRQQFY